MELFRIVHSLLIEHSKFQFAEDCVREIEHGTIVFSYKPAIRTAKMKNEMNTHYQIQMKLTHASVEGYQNILDAIDNYSGNFIREVGISAKKHGYVILCNEIDRCLIGILRSEYANLEKAIDSYYGAKRIGIELNSVKIHKMELQEW